MWFTPSPEKRLSRRRFWAPEVVQTSAMDCGPAALKCILGGFGVNVSYGCLREACQTSVDGTSIDTLEEVANALGLEAAQIMLPPEHAVAPAAGALPAIAVVRMPSGLTHFVVLWRRLGPYLQVMDPARGRRWLRAAAFPRDLYLHTHPVDVDAFRAFAAEPTFTAVLAARFAALGGTPAARHLAGLIGGAVADESWSAIARLDGAARAAELLVGAGILRRGRQAARLLHALIAEPTSDLPDIAARHACVTAAPRGDDGAERVSLTGAVLVHIAGRSAGPPSPARPALSIELAAALSEDDQPIRRALRALGRPQALRTAWVLIPLMLLVSIGGLVEVVLSRRLLSGAAAGQHTLIAGALALFAAVAGSALLEVPLVARARRLGRLFDVELRRAFFRKLPRLGDRYFASRPVSDMAERAHLLHRVRLLPAVAVQVGRTLVELALASAAIAWLYPGGAAIAGALFVVACVVPIVAAPVAAERDLRLRTHAGALLRFYLDALLGLAAVRTHGAGPALVREHAARLAEWRRAGRDVVRTAGRIEAVTVLLAASGAAALVSGYLRTSPLATAQTTGTVFLLLFLALRLPTQATTIVGLWRQFPEHRNVTLRLLEPLGAPEDEAAPPAPASAPDGPGAPRGAAAISFEDVTVEVAGHAVLNQLSLHLQPGAHVAVVGPSGAGKSTLLGLLLGFHRPARGQVLIDGVPLSGDTLETWRAETVWVDPTIQLWNRTLAENIAFGSAGPLTPDALARVMADAELTDLASRLPAGDETTLGEGGGLVSGGEGQRIRFARALARPHVPRVVLLDEPFRGLDRQVRRRLLDRARARWPGATLIFVTHDLEHTLQFPRVLVVDDGKVVEDDAPGVLAARPTSTYRRLLDAEARVHALRWSAPFWRRVTVESGRVEVER
jgi:ABC-type bacteriocin/lantibiotic exporter with double-glycine peptidase domain